MPAALRGEGRRRREGSRSPVLCEQLHQRGSTMEHNHTDSPAISRSGRSVRDRARGHSAQTRRPQSRAHLAPHLPGGARGGVGGDPRHLLVLSKGIWWQPAAGQAQWYTAPPCTMSGCDVLALGAPTSTPTLRSSTPPGQRGRHGGSSPPPAPALTCRARGCRNPPRSRSSCRGARCTPSASPRPG